MHCFPSLKVLLVVSADVFFMFYYVFTLCVFIFIIFIFLFVVLFTSLQCIFSCLCCFANAGVYFSKHKKNKGKTNFRLHLHKIHNNFSTFFFIILQQRNFHAIVLNLKVPIHRHNCLFYSLMLLSSKPSWKCLHLLLQTFFL